jgi:hypothetical protein
MAVVQRVAGDALGILEEHRERHVLDRAQVGDGLDTRMRAETVRTCARASDEFGERLVLISARGGIVEHALEVRGVAIPIDPRDRLASGVQNDDGRGVAHPELLGQFLLRQTGFGIQRHFAITLDIEHDDVEFLLDEVAIGRLGEVFLDHPCAIGAAVHLEQQDQMLAQLGGLVDVLIDVEETLLEPVRVDRLTRAEDLAGGRGRFLGSLSQ